MVFKKFHSPVTSQCLQTLLQKQNGQVLLLVRVLAICAVILIYYQININITSSVNSYISQRKGLCRNSQIDDDNLYKLIQETHRILQKHKIDPFLCYGSLWGALRIKNPLPWDYDFDIGVLYEDITSINITELTNDFAISGIEIFYQYYSGNYKVKLGNMKGDIMIFVSKNGIVQRIGFESWLLFPHYRRYHTFPSRLIERPLPKLKFAGIDYSVPREGIEIQKYFYPTNWWKVITPRGCHFKETALEDDDVKIK